MVKIKAPICGLCNLPGEHDDVDMCITAVFAACLDVVEKHVCSYDCCDVNGNYNGSCKDIIATEIRRLM